MDCNYMMNKVLDEHSYSTVLRTLRELLLDSRREESDPNVMDAFDKVAARVTDAANILNDVGI